jgi:hypothetical protein
MGNSVTDSSKFVGIVIAMLLLMTCTGRTDDAPTGWLTFTNRAGWSIQYSPSWQIGSCNNCTDPTAPNVFVSFFDPLTNGMVMIQRLRDKPVNQSVDLWLNEVKQIAVANPRISEQWISLDGKRALKVITRNPDSTESENVYAAVGSKTFFLQAAPAGNARFYQVYKQMLATFKFVEK